MKGEIETVEIQCPYCWEMIEIVVEDCGENQQYIEDCEVCCQPINFDILLDEHQQMQVCVCRDNE